MRINPVRISLKIALLLIMAAWNGVVCAEVYEFELEEISGFEVSLGHWCACQNEPMAETIYPELTSPKPRYGEIRVDATLARPNDSGTVFRFVIDESKGADSGYDRLYIDLDADGDLTDESVVMPLDNPPEAALGPDHDSLVQRVCFQYVTFSSTGQAGQAFSTETMPRWTLRRSGKSEFASLCFVPTKARKGEIEIAGHRFLATMSHSRPMGTRFDRPLTSLRLEPLNRSDRLPEGLFSDRLEATHKIDGHYWLLSTIPAGDRLFVTRYEGDFGTFTMNSGRLFAGKRHFSGTLMSESHVIVVGSDYNANPVDGSVQSCSLPVGDYLPLHFGFRDGPVIATISDCRHLDGHLEERIAQNTFPVKIRKDETCIFNPLEGLKVLFASPESETRIKLGQTLRVRPVLVDPKVGILIENLRRKDQPILDILSPQTMLITAIIFMAPLVFWLFAGRGGRYRFIPLISIFGLLLLAGCMAAGRIVSKYTPYNPNGMQGYHALEPRVTISREDGQIVAQGRIRYRGDGQYTWLAPEDLQLDGREEVFTITASYDTKELYGEVVGRRQITVCRN